MRNCISLAFTGFTAINRKSVHRGGYHSAVINLCTKADMSQPEWKPEGKIESLFERALAGNKWAGTNAPTAGVRTQKDAPVGKAEFQLYSLATPVSANKLCRDHYVD